MVAPIRVQTSVLHQQTLARSPLRFVLVAGSETGFSLAVNTPTNITSANADGLLGTGGTVRSTCPCSCS